MRHGFEIKLVCVLPVFLLFAHGCASVERLDRGRWVSAEPVNDPQRVIYGLERACVDAPVISSKTDCAERLCQRVDGKDVCKSIGDVDDSKYKRFFYQHYDLDRNIRECKTTGDARFCLALLSSLFQPQVWGKRSQLLSHLCGPSRPKAIHCKLLTEPLVGFESEEARRFAAQHAAPGAHRSFFEDDGRNYLIVLDERKTL